MPSKEMERSLRKGGMFRRELEVRGGEKEDVFVVPYKQSTLSVYKYLWVVGEKALEGKIDAEELYEAVRDGDVRRFLQLAEEHVHLKEPGNTHKKLERTLDVLRKVVHSDAFYEYLLDPKEQKGHAAEIARKRKQCPKCGRRVVGESCSCGWRVPREAERPKPIPVYVRSAGNPLLVLFHPYKGGVLVNPHHPLIRVIGHVVLRQKGKVEVPLELKERWREEREAKKLEDIGTTTDKEDWEDIEVEIVKPQRLSTASVHKYLWVVGEKALEGKIDAEELYEAVRDGDVRRFLQLAEEHVHLKEPGNTHKKLERTLDVLRKVVHSDAFYEYLLDPKEQKGHAAEIARKRKQCPKCGRRVVGESCSCGWRVPREAERPKPIPVYVRSARNPPFILFHKYGRGILVNPHHPLIKAIGKVILRRKGRNARAEG